MRIHPADIELKFLNDKYQAVALIDTKLHTKERQPKSKKKRILVFQHLGCHTMSWYHLNKPLLCNALRFGSRISAHRDATTRYSMQKGGECPSPWDPTAQGKRTVYWWLSMIADNCYVTSSNHRIAWTLCSGPVVMNTTLGYIIEGS